MPATSLVVATALGHSLIAPGARAASAQVPTGPTSRRETDSVDEEGRPDLSEWFGEVALREDLGAAPAVFLTELAVMLGALRPSLINRSQSTIKQDARGIEVEIAHQRDVDASISISIDEGGAIVAWLSAHEHIFPDDATKERSWMTVTVDAIAEVLCGEYVIEDHYRGKRLLKTRIIDVGDPAHEQVMETIGTPLALIPWPGERRTERRRIDFGARRLPDDERE